MKKSWDQPMHMADHPNMSVFTGKVDTQSRSTMYVHMNMNVNAPV
jgi:hypothetical protein